MERSPARRIALVGKDAAIVAATLAAMRAAGHVCRHFADGDAVLRDLDRERFDLLLVAGIQPRGMSAALLAGLHARMGFAVPVIGLGAAGDTEGAVAALEEGMDHIVAWPVAPRMLVAQVNAALRRSGSARHGVDAAVGHLVFRRDGPSVLVDGVPVLVTAKEYALGLMLCRNLARPLSREQIFRAIWAEEMAPTTRTLDVHVSRLRTKLLLRPDRGFRLSALYGHGYRLDYDAPGVASGEIRVARPSLSRMQQRGHRQPAEAQPLAN